MENTFDIKSLRKRLNWRQDRMARYLGISRSSISHYETGRPLSGPLKKLLAALVTAADQGDDAVNALCREEAEAS